VVRTRRSRSWLLLHVTVNFAVAYCPPTSVAVTVVPEVPLGTTNVQLNEPAALVVSDPLVQLEIRTLSNSRDFSVVETENPVPDTVTVDPTGPFVGVTLIVGVVTVNFPVACWPPVSVAVTVVPEVPLGTANEQLNVPVPLVVRPPPIEQVPIDTPSKMSPAVLDTENPLPETVTTAPTGPRFGLTVIVGVVTVNFPVACCPPMSVAATTVPEVPLGTRNVQLKAPVRPVDSDPLVQLETTTLSNTRLTVLDSEKPEPDTDTCSPIGPCFGLTVILGTVTVKVPVAVWPPTSVAVTVVPEVPLGTANVHEKSPEESVPSEPLVQLGIVTPSRTSPTVLDTENPVPATVTVAPTGPWLGLTVMLGVVTVNVGAVVRVLVAVSSPTTEYGPATSLGTAKVQLKAPVPSVVIEVPT